MKAIPITFDEQLLEKLDSDEEIKRATHEKVRKGSQRDAWNPSHVAWMERSAIQDLKPKPRGEQVDSLDEIVLYPPCAEN